MSKLTDIEKDKLDNTCGNLRVTKLGTHVKALEDFVNEMNLDTNANTIAEAINELYGMIVNNDCATIQIPPPGFFTLFGNDEDGKLYCYYNNEDYPPVFRHVETPGELEGTLYLYIADPEGENHYEVEVGHYIAVRHLDDYYTKTQINNMFTVTVEKQQTPTSGYAATYVVKQGGTALSPKINIPKDFLVKSGEVKTCTTANVPIQGLQPGDKYLDFVVNAKDSSATDEHIYIDVHDLGANYTADESTLTLSNNRQFSVKNGGITLTKLASSLQTTINGKEDASNKVNSISSSSTDTQYPSAKAVYTMASGINSFKIERVTALVDHPDTPPVQIDDTIFYLTQNDGGYKKGYYIWDDHEYVQISFEGDGKENTANKVTSISPSSTDTQYPSAKLLYDKLQLKQDASTAFSGNYNDLSNKPSIPTKTSDLTNDGDGNNDFITESSTSGLIKNDGTIDTNTYLTSQDVSGKEDKSNKVTTITDGSTHTQYPSARAVNIELANKLDIIDAFSGDYDDLTNKPSIPSKTSDLTNDSGFLTQHQDVSGKEDVSNKVSSWNSTTTDTHYPSEKLVKDTLDGKVDGITFIDSVSEATSDGIFILLPESFVILTNDLVMNYRDGSQFVALVLKDGEPYGVGQTVTFSINNISTNRSIEANGYARMTINQQPGTYTITTTFRGKTNTNTITIRG